MESGSQARHAAPLGCVGKVCALKASGATHCHTGGCWGHVSAIGEASGASPLPHVRLPGHFPAMWVAAGATSLLCWRPLEPPLQCWGYLPRAISFLTDAKPTPSPRNEAHFPCCLHFPGCHHNIATT